jgi:hypothetical protein
MSNYVVKCEIPDLTSLHSTLLEQGGCRIADEKVEFELARNCDESSDKFRNRCARWISRELSRLNALTNKLLKATSINIDPSPGGITIKASTGWAHQKQFPPSHVGWSEEALEFILSAWGVASHTEDLVLCFVMLDTICEAAEVSQNWVDKAKWPPRFAEVRLIRNLLVHGVKTPKPQVREYLEFCTNSIDSNRFENRYQHLELAQFRCSHLKSAVWKVVMNKVVEDEVDLLSEEPATLRGILLIDNGPHPFTSG